MRAAPPWPAADRKDKDKSRGLTTSPLRLALPRTGTYWAPYSPLSSQARQHHPPEESVKQTELVLSIASLEGHKCGGKARGLRMSSVFVHLKSAITTSISMPSELANVF